MKSLKCIAAPISAIVLCFSLEMLHAQTAAQQPQITRPKDTPYSIVSRDANSRVFQRTIWEKRPDGEWVSHLRSYTELQTGMHYRGPDGEWIESKEEIDPTPGGGFQATQGQHQVFLPQNIYDGAIDLVEPDGQHLKSRPLGINYFDGTNSVLIAELTNSYGELISSNQVIYPDAFAGGFDADLVLTYRKSGFEADLVIRSQPPAPETFSLKSEYCRMELMTEFFNVADPEQTPANSIDGLSDSFFRFNGMTMIQGKAFAANSGSSATDADILQPANPSDSVVVSKDWIRMKDPRMEGRTFLIEAVPVLKIHPQLETLPTRPVPPVRVTSINDVLYKVSATRLLPPRRIAFKGNGSKPVADRVTHSTGPIAKNPISSKAGVVWDYNIVNTGTNMVFRGDDTYYVSNSVYLSGTTVIEGGTVIKYDTNYTCSVNILGTVQCQTGPYRPAILTSASDSIVGQPTSSSSPPPCTGTFNLEVVNDLTEDLPFSVNYGEQELDATVGAENNGTWNLTTTPGQEFIFQSSQTDELLFWPTLQNGKIEVFSDFTAQYSEDGDPICTPPVVSSTGLSLANGGNLHDLLIRYLGTGIQSSSNCAVTNIQFVQCQNAAFQVQNASLYAGNILISKTGVGFSGQSFQVQAENVTYDQGSNVAYSASGISSIALTNALITDVSSFGNTGLSTNGVEFLGSGSGVYQIVGAGSYYLTNSLYLAAGTTNISPGLLAQLQQKTTYPPIVIQSSIAVPTNFVPVVPRDTNALALGFHYSPLDYVFSGVEAKTNITFEPGTVLGWFDSFSSTGYGMSVDDGATVNFNGSATSPCWVVRYDTSQEGGNGNWTSTGFLGCIISGGSASGPANGSKLVANFTKFSSRNFNDSAFRDFLGFLVTRMTDCEFWVAGCGGYNISDNFTNCLIFRWPPPIISSNNATALTMQNCTLTGSDLNTLHVEHDSASTWSVKIFNSAFDGVTFQMDDPSGGNTNITFCDYNAYTNATDPFPTGGGHDKNSITFNWQTSWLGNYYQTINSRLIDAGSPSADLVGLYHFTTQTNQVKETNSPVDIGYHYVALDTNGLPIDTDGDGIPDYIEDSDGDGGAFDSGDLSDWQDYYNGVLPNLTIVSGNNQTGVQNTLLPVPLTISVASTNGSILTNAPITFSVTQGGAQISATTNGAFSGSVSLRTGTNGQASVFMLLPNTQGTTILLTATAWSGSQSNQVTFIENTMQGLLLWLRADAGITNNHVNIWIDQSGNHNDATQTTQSSQPTLTNNVVNGKPAVRFDDSGNGERLFLQNILANTTQAEAIVVLKVTADSPTGYKSLWNLGTGGGFYPALDGTIQEAFGTTTPVNIGDPVQSLDQYHLYDVAGASNYWSAWINGLQQSFRTPNTYTYTTDTELGRDQAVGHYFSGDIVELLIFNRVLSANERSSASSYLIGKYALIAPPYAPSNLTANAISSGQISLSWAYGTLTTSTIFNIERKTGGGMYTQVAAVQNGQSYVDTNLLAGTQYYYRVSASNYGGTSDYSNETNATTLLNGTNVPLGDLKLWLKADSGLVVGGPTTVEAWIDQSGNSNNAWWASYPVYGNPPIVTNNVINGFPAVRFNNAGNGNNMFLPNFLAGTTQAEAVVVLKAVADVPTAYNSMWQLGENTNFYPDINGTIWEAFGSTSQMYVGDPEQPLDQYHIYDIAAGSNYWAACINGVQQSSTRVNAYGFSTAPMLGRDNYAGHSFSGDFVEILVFDRMLTSAERDSVGVYLNGKYQQLTNAPSAPAGFQAKAFSANEVSLLWTNTLPNNTTVYVVERKTGGGNYTQVATVREATTYVDTNVAPSTAYTYRVKAWSYVGESTYSAEATATTPAAGAALPFEDLAVWLHADAGVVQENTNEAVSIWFDQSGNANNAIQVTPASQPVFLASAFNGLPVLHFNGVGAAPQFLNLPNCMSGFTQGEIYAVLRAFTNLPTENRLVWQIGAPGSFYPLIGGDLSDSFGRPSDLDLGPPPTSITNFHIFNSASTAGYWNSWWDGTFLTNDNNATVSFVSSPTLGGASGYAFQGDIAEVLIFDRVLASDERVSVTTYLNTKYLLLQPSVTLVAPTNGQMLSADSTFTLVADTAASADRVAYVQFFDGTTSLGYSSNASYTLAWNNITAGSHSLTVQATDENGLISTSQVVNATADSPPTVTWVSPPNNSSFMANTNITLTVNASDSDGTVTQVQFFHEGVRLGTVTSYPYTMTWNNVSLGSYSLTAQATDNNGLITTSSVDNITVGIPPSVALTSPSNGAIFAAGSNIGLVASASSVDGQIRQVQFFQGTNSLGIVTNLPYELVWSNVAAGSYTLTARATGDDGMTSTSAPVNITIDTPPTVTITAPTNNSSIVPAYTNITITATASDSDGTVTQVQFFQNGILLGTVPNAPYNLTWSNVPAGVYALTARATDNSGMTSTSSVVNITVAGCVITSPTNNVVLTAPATIPIAASVVDNLSISQVQFFQGTTSLGIVTNPPYTVTWGPNVGTNVYSLTAVATDSGGRVLTSLVVKVLVDTNPNTQDSDKDGVSDYTEYLLGRNPLGSNSVSDVNGLINLQIYTPLR